MTLYYLYRIEEDGTLKKKMETHAHSIGAAWMGCKGWFWEGLFLITNSEKTEAKIFKLNREG